MGANNVEAMRQWIRQNRPDVIHLFEDVMRFESDRSSAIFALMCMGFEAGRQHQKYTPDDPQLAPIRCI